MTNDTLQIVDVATGEVVIREITNAEKAQRDSEIAQWKIGKEEQAEAARQAAIAKATATAKLEALGLTADDLKALGL